MPRRHQRNPGGPGAVAAADLTPYRDWSRRRGCDPPNRTLTALPYCASANMASANSWPLFSHVGTCRTPVNVGRGRASAERTP